MALLCVCEGVLVRKLKTKIFLVSVTPLSVSRFKVFLHLRNFVKFYVIPIIDVNFG